MPKKSKRTKITKESNVKFDSLVTWSLKSGHDKTGRVITKADNHGMVLVAVDHAEGSDPVQNVQYISTDILESVEEDEKSNKQAAEPQE